MSVNSYLTNLASELVLNGTEKDHVSKSVDTIKTRLNTYFGNDVTEKKVFGSYDRDTILPRVSDDDSDVDVMVVFKNPNNYQPQSFLNRLKGFAEHFYSQSEIYQSSPTIVLELNHIKFELVPAYTYYGLYYIPDGPTKWKYTDPSTTKDKVVNSNMSNGYKTKPIIRLIKHWNVNKNYRDMSSYYLEEKVADALLYTSYSSYATLAKIALEAIRYATDSDRVKTAISRIDKASEYEEDGMPNSALAEIKKVFVEI